MLGDRTDGLIRAAAERAGLLDLYDQHEAGKLTDIHKAISPEFFERFCVLSADCLPRLELLLPQLVDEIVVDINNGNSAKLHTIREDGWIVASSGPFIVDLRIIRKADKYFAASPCFSATLNMDRNPLRYRRFVSSELLSLPSFSSISQECFSVRPREIACNNGLNSAVVCDEGEAIALCLISLPYSSYDLIYNAETLALAGRFQSDPRDSAVAVALRIFAAGQWSGGKEFAEKYADSDIRETRWAVLNYFWRSNDPGRKAQITRYCSDPDAGIATIAKHALVGLA